MSETPIYLVANTTHENIDSVWDDEQAAYARAQALGIAGKVIPYAKNVVDGYRHDWIRATDVKRSVVRKRPQGRVRGPKDTPTS